MLEIAFETPAASAASSAGTQPSLLNPAKRELEKIPYKISYKYRCSEARCSGHTQSIVDWELGQMCRDWPKKYGEAGFRDKVREKWLHELCDSSRDTSFFTGNMHTHQRSFLILGVFWPPKRPLQMFDPETFA